MVRAAALILAAMVGTGAEAQLSQRDKAFEHRSQIQTVAGDPKLRDSKVVVAVTDGGSRWMIRAGDLADIWTSNTYYPRAWVFADHTKDKTVKAHESRYRVAAQCKEQRFAILVSVDYATDGRILRNDNSSDNPYSYSDIIPETMADAVAKELCPVD